MIKQQEEVSSWLFSLGPRPSEQSAIDRIGEEYKELREATTHEEQAEELADVLMTVLATASILDINLEDYFNRKMEINRNRKWRRAENGNYYHIKES